MPEANGPEPNSRIPVETLVMRDMRRVGTAEFTAMNDQETVVAALQEARRILRDTGSGPRECEVAINSLRFLLDDDQIVHALERIGHQNRSAPAEIVESPWS
ncbi:MAG: hypothetical protein ACRC9K_08205 [Afipia sp.]